MLNKQTLKHEISFSGIGIHSGEQIRMTLKPSRSGKIFFRRLDLGGLVVDLDPRRIDALNCTCLVFESGRIQTMEHLMAVLYMFGLDSLEIELFGGEIPIMDGSAAPLARAVLEAGVVPVEPQRHVVRVIKPCTLEEGGASLSLSPAENLNISYAIDFDHPLIGRQEISFDLTREVFLKEIAPARTFGFLKDIPELRKRGLALGGTLDSAVVLDDCGTISGPLRFRDEFVRHKALDLIGDLALFGHPLLGRFQADKAGHRLHHRAVLFLIENPDFWTFEEAKFPRFLGD
ncbi:MAG: UDP-3-O-[3-hydroxymyristoyl] N-acetylglucosamine deacetylase [Candidatus Aminicenantes bacterium]|nr:UDP-3-O-[3-hydroxymyristoyl] N-acetylglucosamine deacetylase [Candidatus Aminicenantes bacterium]